MRRRLLQLLVAIVTVATVLGAGVVADLVVRGEMEAVARTEIANALSGPHGTIDPDDVQASIGGGSAIMQLLLGTIDQVAIEVPDVTIGAGVADFHAEMVDVPTNQVQPVGRIYSYLELDEAAVFALAEQFVATPVTDVDLEPPYVQVVTEVELPDLGLTTVTIDIDPNVRNGRILLVAEAFSIAGLRLDPAQLQQRIGLDQSTFLDTDSFCIDSSIPESMTVDDFRVSNGSVVIVLGSEQLTVFELGAPHGSCGPP